MRRLTVLCAVLPAVLLLAVVGFAPTAHAAPANDTGLTAKIVATSGQVITGDIDATGFDVGIYIGPGVHGVTVTKATVHEAQYEGILVQDASDVVITHSVIAHNALSPDIGPGLQMKGLVLAGTTHVVVTANTIEDNGAGGISVIDDGPNRPFALVAHVDGAMPVASTDNVLTGNLVQDNAFDCGITVSAKNPGAGVLYNVVSHNMVVVTDPLLGGKPRVGGIAVAGGAMGPVTLTGNVVEGNTVTGGLIPGIALHAFGPGVISGTELIGNVLSHNGEGEVSKQTTGIEIFAVPGVGSITGTQVLADRVSDDEYGVWHVGDGGLHIVDLRLTNVAYPVVP